jgi:hypothetical protein
MKYNILILALIAVFFTSCEKDFLDVKSPNLTDNAIFSDPILFETYVINQYTGVALNDKESGAWGEKPYGLSRGHFWCMWACLTDEAVYSNDDHSYLVQRGQLSPSNYGWTSTEWGRSYRAIRETNLCLSKLPDVPMNDARRKMLDGELRFLRAYRYFNLLKGFGEVPLVGDIVTSMNDDFTPLYTRKSISEVVDYITTELDAAIPELPLDNGSDWKRGRATKGAAMALKSRLLLYAASPLYTGGTSDQQKWQKAADAAKAVMNLNKYQLVTNLDSNPSENYRKLFLTNNTKEDIFVREYTTDYTSYGTEHMNAPNGYDGWGGNCPMQNLVDDYEMSNGLAITDPNSGYNDQNPYVNRDPRFYATVLYNGAFFRGRAIETFMPGGKDSPDGSGAWNTSPTGYSMRKFCDETVDINDWSNMGKAPWKYFRYAEILLNYAEAQNEANGPDNSVYDAVNQIRSRAGMPNLPAGLTKDEMRLKIRNERRIELAYEEHRYFDVRRWKIASVTENMPARGIYIKKNADGSLTFSSKIALSGKSFSEQHYWFPIPLEEINASNGQLKQNPGYN